IKNDFYAQIAEAQKNCATHLELQQLLGKGRAKKGIFEGDLKNGELEIGQISAILKNIKPVEKIINETWLEFSEALQKPL
ncbi:MAG: nitronate monooxygenase, partial [Bacteroidia bacterium]